MYVPSDSVYNGFVYGRAVVRDPNTGLPRWAEYNEQGGHSELNLDLEAASRSRVIAGELIRSYHTRLAEFRSRYQGKIELFDASTYNNGQDILTKDGTPIAGLPNLRPGHYTIALPAREKRFSANGRGVETLQFPFDIQTHDTLDPSIASVMVNETGQFLVTSAQRIGYLTAFVLEKDGTVKPSSAYDPALGMQTNLFVDKQALNPMPGVPVTISGGMARAQHTVTDAFGQYRLMLRFGCPGGFFQTRSYLDAEFTYGLFHPKGTAAMPYWLTLPLIDNCVGSIDPYTGVSHSVSNATLVNVQVGITMLTGVANLLGAQVSDSEPTTYHAAASPADTTMILQDYDGDGVLDGVVQGQLDANNQFTQDPDGNLYGVFLSGHPKNDGQPNFTRIMDVIPNLSDQGLVSTISKDDLQNTDIYAFREATGELITERRGLTAGEVNLIGGSSLTENNQFTYTFAIRSPEDMISMHSQRHDGWEAWQADNKMNLDLHVRQADHLRSGETIRIVAINRATGYMGTALTILNGSQGTAGHGGDLTTWVPPIIMGPPNLKVWATRRYQPQGLAQNSDSVRNTISNEGAATTDDYLIEIHTEWLDENGQPLPEDFTHRGYTGRLVKVASNDIDPYQTRVQEFAINPGRHMQVLKFREGEQNKYHYHLQVNANPISDENDFSTGNHTGVLAHRPSRYVPVRVPLYNEAETKLTTYLQKTQSADPDNYTEQPIFNWVYRPELSFSVVDLHVDSILRESQDNPDTEPVDIIDDRNPVISSGDDLIKILFDLSQSEFDRITPLDSAQTFILAIGEQEIQVTVDKGAANGQQIQFTNLEHLAELSPEDYLSIRFYLNEDAQNTLWEWAFGYNQLIVDTSDDPKSRDKRSFVIVPDNTVVYQSEDETLSSPQKPFDLILVRDFSYDAKETYQWEISVPDTDKYGRFEFVGNAPGGTVTTKNNRYIWSSHYLTDDAFKTLKIRPREPEPRHTPDKYCGYNCTPKGGTNRVDVKQKNPQYEYDVKVTIVSAVDGIYDMNQTIKMDDKDAIRQEYINHIITAGTDGVVSSSRIKNVYVPTREQLLDKNSLDDVLVGNWSQGEYQHLRDTHMVRLANMVKDAFKDQAAVSLTETVNDETPPQPTNITFDLSSGNELLSDLRVNSGWRNPERNEVVSGVKTSNHMTGHALDIGTKLQGTSKAELLWVLWRAVQTLPAREDGIRFRYLLERGTTAIANVGDTTLYPGVDTEISMLDEISSDGELIPDGIPDDINQATHIHVETFWE